MDLDILYKIRQDKNMYMYLKYHSYWYKILKRDPTMVKIMEKEMKKEFKLTTSDKINEIYKKMELFNTFLNMLE